jgi:hypothetical protein
MGGIGGTVANCARTLFGRYLLRNDGALLYETDPPSTAQTAVLDAATGLPLTDVIAAFDGPAPGCAILGTAKTAWCWRTAPVTIRRRAPNQRGSGSAALTSDGVYRVGAATRSPNCGLLQ